MGRPTGNPTTLPPETTKIEKTPAEAPERTEPEAMPSDWPYKIAAFAVATGIVLWQIDVMDGSREMLYNVALVLILSELAILACIAVLWLWARAVELIDKLVRRSMPEMKDRDDS